MPAADRRLLRFVRLLLLPGAHALDTGDGTLRLVSEGRTASVDLVLAKPLLSAGVLRRTGAQWWAGAELQSWLRRALLEPEDRFADQHRDLRPRTGGGRLNLAESPLARLASASGGEAPFLEPHQVEAGERFRRLAERARLQPRLTMNYSAVHTAGGDRTGTGDISDMAADARRALARIMAVLPRDCAAVVMDVCGLLKGLQLVETERGWPRRSAKLVLRIGLEQLAQHFGLSRDAVGGPVRGPQVWRDDGARPERFE